MALQQKNAACDGPPDYCSCGHGHVTRISCLSNQPATESSSSGNVTQKMKKRWRHEILQCFLSFKVFAALLAFFSTQKLHDQDYIATFMDIQNINTI